MKQNKMKWYYEYIIYIYIYSIMKRTNIDLNRAMN